MSKHELAQRKKPPRGARRGYHHGDLRRALLDAAATFLATHDVTSLSLQVVARAAKVSPGAPYHYFADRRALLAALATEGFERLFRALTAATERERTPKRKIEAFATAYLDFADADFAHYRIMFLSDVGDRSLFPELHEMSGRCITAMLAVLATRLPNEPASRLMAHGITLLSTCHGFASLRAAGVLSNIPGGPSLEVLRQTAVAHMLDGLGKAQPKSR